MTSPPPLPNELGQDLRSSPFSRLRPSGPHWLHQPQRAEDRPRQLSIHLTPYQRLMGKTYECCPVRMMYAMENSLRCRWRRRPRPRRRCPDGQGKDQQPLQLPQQQLQFVLGLRVPCLVEPLAHQRKQDQDLGLASLQCQSLLSSGSEKCHSSIRCYEQPWLRMGTRMTR